MRIYIKLHQKRIKTKDRQVYFAFINLFLCLCTKTTLSHRKIDLYNQIFFEIFEIIKIFEMFKNVLLWTVTIHLIPKFVRFALSLTIAEICANLWGFLIFWKIRNFRNVEKKLIYSLTIFVIPKFRPFCSISYGFWVLKFKF